MEILFMHFHVHRQKTQKEPRSTTKEMVLNIAKAHVHLGAWKLYKAKAACQAAHEQSTGCHHPVPESLQGSRRGILQTYQVA